MNAVLQQFNLSLQVGPDNDVCTLHFNGKPDVHLIGAGGGHHINVMCEAGQLSKMQSAPALIGLLALNRCDSAEYVVGVTLHRQSGTVIVCSRQAWATLSPDAVKELLRCVHQKVEAVQQVLTDCDTRLPLKSEGSMARLGLSRQFIP